MKKIILPFAVAALLLSGCSADANAAVADETVDIVLNGDSISCESDFVEISGSKATIRDAGCYKLSGELTDGMLIIDAEKSDKIQLVLDGAKIHSESSAAIYVLQADKLTVTLSEGSENELSNGGSFVAIDENDIDAVIFSKDDLTLDGSGSLKITSPAGHAVVSKDSLEINGGSYNVSAGGGSANAGEKSSDMWGQFMGGGKMPGMGRRGMERGDIQFRPENAEGMEFPELPENMKIPEMPEGMTPPEMPEGMTPPTKPEGMTPPQIPMENMGLDTETSEDSVNMKGFAANDELTISGGSFTVDCADDAFHSDLNLTINAGEFEISAGDDALHAEENLSINGGQINVTESYEGIEALHISISGGDIVIRASDDGINAAGGTDANGSGGMFSGPMSLNADGSIIISGGNIRITAYGDGMDANGSIEITGGNTIVCGPCIGDTAILDYYTTATISGGSFIGTGSAMMAQSFSEAKQGLVFEKTEARAAAGTTVNVQDSSGKTVLSFSPELDFEMILVSSPELSVDENYSLSVERK